MITLISRSPEETRFLGKSIGQRAKSRDIFSLLGPLGAGKTVLAQGILAGLGVSRPVTSPTFNIVNEYQGRVPVYHLDLYRLEETEELVEIGLEEMLLGEAILVIEWGDRFPEVLPAERLEISLDYSGNELSPVGVGAAGSAAEESRVVALRPYGERYGRLLRDVMGL
ncbi:MAG: tRNA (adenosine(37)-N6)-threonylcarbamoyltransferase complex ATPase subunit type 1 TsaE [Firmicutes bacterium]|nr:tRNA (adenosine(37)-N6)-threonylcarbamoyltransferase complex ATPase subunit type 1 TsaE [Bacillota bacterium]MCL5038519.1 tRNA (adenosine(37)-N6)-threonylcarbamoyltransferase complex ATPase subunit type 1 TsaE [Bacillota bacterium]